MSLFSEESPVPSSKANSKSLFGDEAPAVSQASSSLFADDGGTDSPWNMPTPKKAARQDLAKTLLPATDVPEYYIDAFDTVLESKDRVGAGVGLSGIRKILGQSGISPADQSKILNLIVPAGQESTNGLGRSEFNVLLALIGVAQENDDISFDSVDDRRRSRCTPCVYLYVLICNRLACTASSIL